MQKLEDPKVQVIPGHEAAPDVEIRRTGAPALKGSFFRHFSRHVPKADLPEVRRWVGLEERIVQDYQKERRVMPRTPVFAQAPRPRPVPPAFETFSTQTTAVPVISLPQLQEPAAAIRRNSGSIFKVLWVSGWIAAGILAFFYAPTAVSLRETSARLSQLQDENKDLERSYGKLIHEAAQQKSEIRLLNSRLLGLTRELKAAKQQVTISERALEKKYRQELMRITVQYETQLEEMQQTLKIKESIFEALKAQLRAFEEIADQGGIAAVSGAASRVLSSMSSAPSMNASGSMKVSTVNIRQGFLVIDAGSEKGVRYEDTVTISSSYAGPVIGRVDRVYPTMATVIVPDVQALGGILEGDPVSFT